MKKLFLNVTTLALLMTPVLANAAPETYHFDPNHTNLTWHANHFGFSNPSGKFMDVTGTLVLDEAAPQESTLNVDVKPASIMTGLDKFNTHLKSKDFFNVEKFPDAKFVSTKVVRTGVDTAKVEGNLTLLGVTKPATLDVKLNKLDIQPMTKIKTAGFTASTTIKRSEFGLNYALPAVSDDVKIDIEVEAQKVDSK